MQAAGAPVQSARMINPQLARLLAAPASPHGGSACPRRSAGPPSALAVNACRLSTFSSAFPEDGPVAGATFRLEPWRFGQDADERLLVAWAKRSDHAVPYSVPARHPTH